MSKRDVRRLHPLLLDQSYWHNRLEAMRLETPSQLFLPRPDLTTPFEQVLEFRIRAHDGVRIFGLLARSAMNFGSSSTPVAPGAGSRGLGGLSGDGQPAKIRLIGPCELPEIDRRLREDGWAQFVLQSPAGRRLEDRVLDLVLVCQLARSTEGIDPERIELDRPSLEPTSDAILIASRLLSDGFSG
jgi:hypothetical protein